MVDFVHHPGATFPCVIVRNQLPWDMQRPYLSNLQARLFNEHLWHVPASDSMHLLFRALQRSHLRHHISSAGRITNVWKAFLTLGALSCDSHRQRGDVSAGESRRANPYSLTTGTCKAALQRMVVGREEPERRKAVTYSSISPEIRPGARRRVCGEWAECTDSGVVA